MTAAYLAPPFVFQGITASGVPAVGGLLYTYAAGTTTPIATFTDNTASTPNLNPVQLNALGQASVWLLPNVGYKFVLFDQFNVTQYTQDQIFNNTLTSLFGGVDTGAVNAYVLNFTANFQALTNGIVIYWVPANTNTGPSTLNVNGLGPVAIVNQQTLLPLTASQIIGNGVTVVMFLNGNWVLTSSTGSVPTSGTFIPTFDGFSSPPGSQPAVYTISGNNVILRLPGISGTSSQNFFRINNIPAAIIPAFTQFATAAATDNGTIATQLCAIRPLQTPLATVLDFYKNFSLTGWTNSGTKGYSALALSYILI